MKLKQDHKALLVYFILVAILYVVDFGFLGGNLPLTWWFVFVCISGIIAGLVMVDKKKKVEG